MASESKSSDEAILGAKRSANERTCLNTSIPMAQTLLNE